MCDESLGSINKNFKCLCTIFITDARSMGNSSKKLAAKCTLLTKEEQKYMAHTFKNASRSSDKIQEEELVKYWGSQIDPRLAQYLCNYLFGFGPNKSPVCDFNKFAELYVFNVRGTVDEKVKVLYTCLGKELGQELPFQLLREYCESIVSTYIRMVKNSKHPNPTKWIAKGFRSKAQHVQTLGEAMAAGVHKDIEEPGSTCSPDQIERWISANTLQQGMTMFVFENLYGMNEETERQMLQASASEGSSVTWQSLFPFPCGIEPLPDYPAFIDLSHIAWLNSQIPREHQEKWRFLFSSHIHGESFSTMAGRIQDVGPSLIIIEDTNGYIFGAYASVSWQLSPTFHGNDHSFVFTLAPKIRIYPATTFNNHYQYMNFNTKTLPNGLIVGGQFEYPGLFIHADPFGGGSTSETCITYRGYKRLTKEEKFKIRSLEVWGVGEKPLTIKESEERDPSILDRNPEAKAILELAGRTRHSEGIREPDA